MGYDSFGLPAENHAIRTGEHPRVSTERSIASFRGSSRLGHLDRLEPRALDASPEYYRWTQWIFLRLFEAGLAYRTDAARAVVSEGSDRPRQRAGDRRSLRALRHRGRPEEARAVVLPDHRLRGSPARRLRPARVLARARRDDAAQLDRPLRGRRGRLSLRGARDRLPGVHDPPRHALRRHLLRARARAPRARPADRGDRQRRRGPRVRRGGAPPDDRRARRRGSREDGRAPRAHRRQPRQRRADPDVRGRLRADGVRDRSDHGRAGPRSARLRVRRQVRSARAPGRRPGRRLRGPRRRGVRDPVRGCPHRQLRRPGRADAGGREEVDHRRARERGKGAARRQLPAPRLAALATALLGLPDPDRPLSGLRRRAGPRRPAAGRAARDRGLPAEGKEPAGDRDRLGGDDLPAL